MAGRRRRRTYYVPVPRVTRRSPVDAAVGWIASLWRELTDEQRRDLVGLGLIAGGVAIVASMLASWLAPHATLLTGVRELTVAVVGVGWPLVVGGATVAGVVLIHPSAGKSVQRIQGVALALAGLATLGLLSVAREPAGGWVGAELATNLSRGLGAAGAALVLLAALAVAIVFAVRLRVSQLVLAVIGRARASELLHRPRRRGARVARPRPARAAADPEREQLVAEPPSAPGGPPETPEGAEEDLEDEHDDDDREREDEEDDDDVVVVQGGQAAPLVVTDVRRRQHSAWNLPSLSLLTAQRPRSRRQEDEVKARVAAIESKLRVLGIPGAKVIDVDHGPTVTRYVLAIPDDVAVSKVEKLQKDLSLALAASPLRIEAPIPGRSAIGIEVPAARREIVSLRGVLEAEGLVPKQRALAIGLGRDVAGVAVIADLATMPHLLVAGATGQGKSVGINGLISSLLIYHSPESLRLLLVDPKRVELAGYAGLPHLAAPVIVEAQQATQALTRAVAEMERRFKTLAHAGVRNIAGYNARAAERRIPAMPYLVIVVDELADLMMVSRAEAKAEQRAGCVVEDCIARLGQMARAVGIHLVLATQRPSVDVITGLIKANIPSRIAFTVASGPDSRVILDTVGAEKLIGRGDMLYQPVDGGQVRLQGAYMEDAEVDAIVEHWRRQGTPNYLGGLVDADADEVAAARLNRQGGDAES